MAVRRLGLIKSNFVRNVANLFSEYRFAIFATNALALNRLSVDQKRFARRFDFFARKTDDPPNVIVSLSILFPNEYDDVSSFHT